MTIKNNLKSFVNIRTPTDMKNHIVNVVKGDIQTVSNVLFGRSSYPPSCLDILDQQGKHKIISMRVCRTPLSSVVMSLMNVVSFGKFRDRMKNESFDTLFHLSLHVRLSNNKVVSIEKTETLKMSMNPKLDKYTEITDIKFVPDITLFELVNNTHKLMGTSSFFGYSAKSNNCQDFVVSILKANHVNESHYVEFIKQETDQLFDTYLRKMSNTVTDIGNRAGVLIEGGNIECEQCQCKVKNITKHNKTKKHNSKLL